MIPGEYQIQDGEIELNAGRRTLTLCVANSATDRFRSFALPLFETNDALTFDRAASRGMRLNIPAAPRCASNRARAARWSWSSWPASAECSASPGG